MQTFSKMKGATTVNEAAVEPDHSPALTSSIHSRKSASSASESAYLKEASIMRWVRLGLSFLVVGISAAIVGCLAHVLHYYNQTNLQPAAFLSLWPEDVDIKPTLGTLVPAAIATLTGLLYIVFAVIPSPRSRTLYQVLLFLTVSIATFIATLFAVLFKQLLLYRFDAGSRETLQTWTCKFYYGARDFGNDANSVGLTLSGNPLIPAGFKKSCMESMAGQWLMVSLLAVELGCCGVAVWGFVAEKRIQQSRASKHAVEKFESECE